MKSLMLDMHPWHSAQRSLLYCNKYSTISTSRRSCARSALARIAYSNLESCGVLEGPNLATRFHLRAAHKHRSGQMRQKEHSLKDLSRAQADKSNTNL